ncbi:hypothetical protein ScPMuIL_018809 [Solemya velum]
MAQNILVAAGFLVYRRLQNEIQYLLLQTSYGEHHWTPPKGHTDPGESEIEAAMRETKEEAGLDPIHLTIIDSFQKVLNYEVRGKPKRVVYWLAQLKDSNTPVILSEEHTNFKWLGFKDASELLKYNDMQVLLKEAHAFIQNLGDS